MKAWLLDRIGEGISRLRFADVPDPSPANGEIVLRLLAATLNPADRYLAEGQYPARPTFPHILGRDGVGIVEAVGVDVDRSLLGQRRVVLPSEIGVDRAGTFAERVAVPLNYTATAPERWSEEQCAAAPLVYLTAWQALTQWGDLPPGIILITGVSGGVGVASVQLALALGHTVFGLSRDAQKHDRLRQLGVSQMFSPAHTDWPKQLLAATGKQRVNLAIDSVGGPLFNRLLEPMAAGGCISVVGRPAGAVPEFNTASLLFRRLKIGGVVVTGYTVAERQLVWNKVVNVLLSTQGPLIDSVHSFDQLPAAFTALNKGPLGKIVLSLTHQ